ncbi:6190_t:CDS:1, partial [Paraglomus occultum]
MNDAITLMCLVFGETSDRAFSVDINKTATVGHLKDLIKLKKQNDFRDIDADKLTLFRVSISIDNDIDLDELETRMDINDETNGVQKLHPAKKISTAFPDEPAGEHIHIIVQPPPPAYA